MTGAGRFAPSPSGDLHVGNLRTALLGWLFARTTGRAFRLRIDDLDRVAAGAAERQVEDLAALGLDWDGPVLTQSRRSSAYAQALIELGASGRVYPCFCTRSEIQEAASAPQSRVPGAIAPGDAFLEGAYPGTCRNLTPDQVAARRSRGRPPALRLRAEAAHFTVIDELWGASTAVVDDLVLVNVGAKGASVVAFDKNTGKEVWKKLDDAASYSSPLLYDHAGSSRVALLTAKGLVSFDPRDGTSHWRYPFVDLLLESSCTPMVIDGKLLVSSITAGTVLIEETGQEPPIKKVWAKSWNCYFSTPVAVGKDSIYMVTGDLFSKNAVMRCIDAKTGNELWNRKNVGTYHATLLRTGDNKLLLVEEKGDLVLVDANRKEYRELSRTKICGNTWAHPALANGRLYIRDAKELICVEMPK